MTGALPVMAGGAGNLRPKHGWPTAVACALLIIGFLVLWLVFLGRSFVCPCGVVEFWQGELTPAENSQHFSDWYSALHAVFGMGLFLFIDWMKPQWTFRLKLVVAIAGSAVWEAAENLPVVIALFNEPSDPLRYEGDSILNALSDTLFVVIGFGLASRLPLAATLVVAAAVEIVVSIAINDGLLLGTLRIFGIAV